jgi:hypothetical protein
VHHTEGHQTARPEVTATPRPTGPDSTGGDTDLAVEVATLRDAIATRTIIGQATGLLAGQLNITTPMAWRVMRRLSNETNIKLRDIARALVDAHDGRRPPGDEGVARAIGAALGPALAAARDHSGGEAAGEGAEPGDDGVVDPGDDAFDSAGTGPREAPPTLHL